MRTTARRHAAISTLTVADSWAEPQISIWWPALAAALSLGHGGLTALQVCLSGGHVAGALAGSWLASRIRTAPLLLASGVALYGGYPLALLAPNAVLAGLCLTVAGLGNGIYNVPQKSLASFVERPGRRHTIIYTALGSATVLVAALTSGLALDLDLAPSTHLALTALVAVAAVALATRAGRLPDVRARVEHLSRPPGYWRALLPLAGVAAVSVIPIGIVYTRGPSLMLALGAGGLTTAFALAAFALAELLTLVPLYLSRDRIPPVTAARVGGVVAACGALLLCLAAAGHGGWRLAVVALLLVGAGTTPLTPLCHSITGHLLRDHRAQAIGHLFALHLFAVAMAPVLVLLASQLTDPTMAAGVVILACSVVLAIWTHPLRERTPA